MMECLTAPLEVKFATAEAETGQIEGYASVFGEVDGHNDVVMPGAFRDGLAMMKAQGRSIPMHLNHGLAAFAGAVRAIGRWDEVAEDERGLVVKGTLLGTNTDAGRYLYERIKGGAFGGLSIGFTVPPGGSARGKHGGREIRRARLAEVSIVDAPSNARALLKIKSAPFPLGEDDDDAARAVRMLHEFKSRYAAGDRPTERELESVLRDALGLSRSDASDLIAGRGWKTLRMRDSASEAKQAAAKRAREIGALLDGFTLPSF